LANAEAILGDEMSDNRERAHGDGGTPVDSPQTRSAPIRLVAAITQVEGRMSWFYGILIGLGIGVGGTIGVGLAFKSKEVAPPPVIVSDPEVAIKLTDLDLIKPLCTPEFIKENSDLMCREMWCLMQTRGLDAKVSETMCESISNLANTLIIIEACEDGEDCLRLFRERK
tara:strand:+ start:3145 stop:3654 length:510 start_codon:yes stop_codon:yes gene_type:complete